MSATKPRAAYCTGCDTTFPKMHLLFEHRRREHCGGRFLPEGKKIELKALRLVREHAARIEREELAKVMRIVKGQRLIP